VLELDKELVTFDEEPVVSVVLVTREVDEVEVDEEVEEFNL